MGFWSSGAGQSDSGLIFYPGGRVVPTAYAPYAHAIAAQGYLTIIVPMPLNLAVFGIENAQPVIDAFPVIAHWAIGGHSLGGAMAARFAANHPDEIDALLLWGAYADVDLSRQPLAVTSIYATLDGLTTAAKIDETKHLLPPDTRFVAIEGGNHGQFGWYGPQPGDNPASISRETQQAQTLAATVDLLAHMKDQS